MVRKHFFSKNVHWLSTLTVKPIVSIWLLLTPVTNPKELGTLNETCNFFKYSPKRSNLLLCVIEDSPDTKKTTLKNMCKRRSVERHKAYEVFFAFFSCIMRALEVMANEHLFAGQYGDAAWSWDTVTKNKASGLTNAISSFYFIITLLTAVKCLSVLKCECKTSEERSRCLPGIH